MGDLGRDLKYSVRMLVKNPVFTVAAVVTLALGIGLNAATFSAVNGILLRPLPGVERPEELVQLYRAWPGMEYGSSSVPHYQDLRDRTGDGFESMAAWFFQDMALSTDQGNERVIGLVVSANFFQTYGVRPALGRAFLPGTEDVGPGAHAIAILGHGYWESRFGADPDVVGRTIGLNGRPYQVVGVAPEGFQGPMNVLAAPIYVPLMMTNELQGFDRIGSRGNNNMNVVGRLRDDTTLERATQVLEATLLQLRDEYPDSYEDQVGTTVVRQNEAGIHPSMRNAQVGMSAVMMGVVSLLLLIACVNVANLFLTRARERRREMGIRLSLGAGRTRIVRQLLTESLVFSTVAGAAGLGLAQIAVKLLSGVRPPMDGPWSFGVEMDSTVLLFTIVVSLLAGVLFGLAPALQAANPDTVAAVKGETGDGGGSSKASRALVVAQMALSLLLLVSSGLFLRSLQGATEIDPGFDQPSHLVVASVDPELQGYDRPASRAFQQELLERVVAMPEVTRAGFADWLPLGLNNSDTGVSIPGYEFAEGERQNVQYASASEGYIEALGIDLVEGRTFTRQDDGEGPPVIIINRRFAERFWPGESAIGKTVTTAGSDRQVIGVVETGKVRTLGEVPTEFMYFPHRERYSTQISIVARTTGSASAVAQQIARTVREMDADMPVFDVRTMEDHMGLALLPARLGGSVLGLFGVLGLVLAAVGVYGVMAYSVARRTREIGIRVALGADRRRVTSLVVGEGMRLALFGAALGLVAAIGAGQLVKGMLYNVSALDPVAFLGVPALLVGVAALAVYIPARRAAGVEPSRALKSE